MVHSYKNVSKDFFKKMMMLIYISENIVRRALR